MFVKLIPQIVMNKINYLSKRFEQLLTMILPGQPLYDLCCDHGLLGLAALDRGLVPAVSLIDRSPSVIATLKERCQIYLEPDSRRMIMCMNGSDLQPVSGPATIVIAGVGGQTIVDILEGIYCDRPLEQRLLLGPHRGEAKLLDWLSEQGWEIQQRKLVIEKGREHSLLQVGV